MIAVKDRKRQWQRTAISAERRITAEMKTAMVDVLVKAKADLNTQENVR